MLETAALAQERAMLSERLLRDIERRHGLLHATSNLPDNVTDRFLVAYLPETHDGTPVPQTLEYAFTPSLAEAVRLLSRVVDETPHGWGSACYIHDLNTGSSYIEDGASGF